MNVLLIGGGGREHAIAWALSASPLLTRLYCAPGNAGIAECAEIVRLDPSDHAAVITFCRSNSVSLVVIGPEAPLVAGLADALGDEGVRVFGPSAAAARLEGSKGFAKDLCRELGVPTARYARFTREDEALAHLRARGAPAVIKADGLAAGKGVVVAETEAEAVEAARACFAGAFGAAGAAVVIEDRLIGREASFFALVDGNAALPFGSAQDHKRAFDGDRGPNTGGMGAFSPSILVDEVMAGRVMDTIVLPIVEGMKARGTPYRGILYAGLMLTDDGPQVIEFNVRFGDPETQALLPRLQDDLLTLLAGAADGVLSSMSVRWRPGAALTVALTAQGYPGAVPSQGSEIRGVERAGAVPNVTVFHAATRREGGRLLAAGGRVLNVTATGDDLVEARARAYEAIGLIDWPEGRFRSDIGATFSA